MSKVRKSKKTPKAAPKDDWSEFDRDDFGGGWNYRILKHTDPQWGESYGLYEVFYNGKGKPTACSVEPECGLFDSRTELIETLEMMLKDARRRRPLLDYDSFGSK